MWFNSMIRETLPGLERGMTFRESGILFGAIYEVLHGCRQLVP